MSFRYVCGQLAERPETAEKQEGDNVYRFILSTEAVDRDGDVVLSSAWDLENYKKNPVVLMGHNRDKIVGKAVFVGVINKQLVMDLSFADTEHGREAKELVDFGALSAMSAGFRIKGVDDSDENRKKYGVSSYGLLINKAELMEGSLVAVPANQEALRLAHEDGLVCTKTYKDLATPDSRLEDLEASNEALVSRVKALELALAAFDAGSAGKSVAQPHADAPTAVSDPYSELMKAVARGRLRNTISRGISHE